MRRDNLPIMIGMKDTCTKVMIGIKSDKLGGYDAHIVRLKENKPYDVVNAMTHKELIENLSGQVCCTLHFCTKKGLEDMIKGLEDIRDEWKAE